MYGGIHFLRGNPAYVMKGIHFLRGNPKGIHQNGPNHSSMTTYVLKFFPTSLKCCVYSSVTKIDFQVLCLQVGGSRKISEVQVRVCYYWQRLFSFT